MSRRVFRNPFALAFALVLAIASVTTVSAAENLRLAPDLSFRDDSSARFPIEGDQLGAGAIVPGRPTVIFFGTGHCWNTNREAERLVALYPKFRDRFTFIVVDVAHPAPAQRPLIASYYRNAIPTLAILAADGRSTYVGAGETAAARGDGHALEALLQRALE